MASTTPPRVTRTVRSPVARRTRVVYAVLGVIALLVLWQLLSLWVDPVFVASPVETAKALGQLAAEGPLGTQLLITLKRLVIGLAIGAGVGWIVGLLAGFEPVCLAPREYAAAAILCLRSSSGAPAMPIEPIALSFTMPADFVSTDCFILFTGSSCVSSHIYTGRQPRSSRKCGACA